MSDIPAASAPPPAREPTTAEGKGDKELELYRNLLETPKTFKDGFGWTTVVGILFCGFVMMPGSIYLGLMTGGSMGSAATWVTLILFSEIARRSMKALSAQNLVVLLRAAGIMMMGSALAPGGPMGDLVYRAYLAGSDAVRDAGLRGTFPAWYVPKLDSPAIVNRDLLHHDWLLPIGLVAAMMVIGFIKNYTIGYFFFRLTSDVEKLPFPLAPVQAQGAMALSESDERPKTASGDLAPATRTGFFRKTIAPAKSPRWRHFSLGATLGIAFGALQIGIPALTGLFLDKPVFLLPQPWLDTTTLTEAILPATPTGVTIDLGIVLLGMVLPFWAVVGSFAAIALTLVLNPLLHHAGVIASWQPGMDTVNTIFANDLDFYLSFGIGAGFGIAAISIFATLRDVRLKLKAIRKAKLEATPRPDPWATPPGRGDYPLWIALVGYVIAAGATVAIVQSLLHGPASLFVFLLIFAFIYSPFISYVNARLLGIAGTDIDIPFIKESAFIVSGASGVSIWLAPIPVENFGQVAQGFRVNELTGVKLWSLIKTDLVALPVLFLLSLTFWSFIWKANPIPSASFPSAQLTWELKTKRDALLFSSTLPQDPSEQPAGRHDGAAAAPKSDIGNSQFIQAMHGKVIGSGFAFTVIMYSVLSLFGLPVLFVYGLVRGLGQVPHVMVLEIVGALLARRLFGKRMGMVEFRRTIPTIFAGYMTGVGLIGMATIALRLIQEAIARSAI